MPLGVIIARLTANLVAKATEGDVRCVLRTGTILLRVVITMKLYDIIVGTYYQRTLSKALHKCKISLYKHFLSNPLHILFSSQHGDSIEKLNDDFNVVTGQFVSLYPGFCAGVVTAVTYFVFIMAQNPLVAFTLFGISLLQIVPPVVIKKYMQVNYDNCRDMEAKISNFTVEGCHDFDTIKLYHLKQWWLDRLKKLHKEYVTIGSKSEITCFVDDAITNLVDNILHYGAYGI